MELSSFNRCQAVKRCVTAKSLENEPEDKNACVNTPPRADNTNCDYHGEQDETERKEKLVPENPHHSHNRK